ncbi:MAG: EAL domain-containing protein [Pseudomonadota bacterium]
MTESSPGRQSATDPERLSPQTALIEATQSLEGAALEASLGNIVRLLLESPQGGFFLAGCNFDETSHQIIKAVTHDAVILGHYALTGRSGGYGAAERQQLAALAQLTGWLLQLQAKAERLTLELGQTAARIGQQLQILDQIHDSVITMDLAGFVTHWNKGAERLFGYTAGEAVGNNILFLYTDEDEVAGGDLRLQGILGEHGGHEMEVRRRRKSGEIFWASLSLSLMHDANGEPSGLIGYLSDITERIAAAEKQRLNTRLFEYSEEGIYITDAHERIISVNPAFCRITGYSENEVLGQTPHLFDSDRHNEDFHQLMRNAIQVSGSWHGEVWERRKNGELYLKENSVCVVKNAQNKITHYFSIFSDITEKKRNEERINYLAYYEALTGLPNRMLMHKLIDQALAEYSRTQQLGALLFIDLNRFKPINDSLGHDVGDRLLQQVGQRFRNALRNVDVVARMGGDEFVAALFSISKREHAGFVAKKLLESLNQPILLEGHVLRVGASIGISVFPDDSLDTPTLLRYADVAMYRAKQIPQGGYAFFSSEMNQTALDRLKIEADLRRALERGELMLHYQPKVNLASGRIIGAEALVRWNHPDRGMVPPGEFIPVAEDTGLVVGIGAWVLGGLQPLKLAVNISARQISPDLPRKIGALLSRHGLTPAWLELELTESMLMHNTESVISMMNELHAMGIALSLDDFGTGFSSLSYLKRFPVDTLKIDRSFITGIPGDPDDCAIAGAIVGMAKQLRLKVIAEGVETTEQFDFLKSLDCDEIKGYLYSRPLPADEFLALVLRQAAV